jgi:hypothetical protein
MTQCDLDTRVPEWVIGKGEKRDRSEWHEVKKLSRRSCHRQSLDEFAAWSFHQRVRLRSSLSDARFEAATHPCQARRTRAATSPEAMSGVDASAHPLTPSSDIGGTRRVARRGLTLKTASCHDLTRLASGEAHKGQSVRRADSGQIAYSEQNSKSQKSLRLRRPTSVSRVTSVSCHA